MKKTQTEHHSPAPSSRAALDAERTRNRPDSQYLDALHINRRSRLTLLIQQRADGNAAAFATLLGYPKSQIHQFISRTYNGGRSMGERAARELEHRAGLPFGWLDQAGDDARKISCTSKPLAPTNAGTSSAPPQAMGPKDHADMMRESADMTSPVCIQRPQPTFAFNEGELQPGERYAGIVGVGGILQHLILLPAKAYGVSWQQAKTFAAAVGGELPDLSDFDVLLQNLQQEFPGEDAYWSSEWLNRKEAFYLDFEGAGFRDLDSVDSLMQARAVRRIFAGREQSILLNWGAHIRTMRKAAGVTVERLAVLMSVTPDVIVRWEGGEVRSIPGPVLAELCAVLNVDANWLLGADDE